MKFFLLLHSILFFELVIASPTSGLQDRLLDARAAIHGRGLTRRAAPKPVAGKPAQQQKSPSTSTPKAESKKITPPAAKPVAKTEIKKSSQPGIKPTTIPKAKAPNTSASKSNVSQKPADILKPKKVAASTGGKVASSAAKNQNVEIKGKAAPKNGARTVTANSKGQKSILKTPAGLGKGLAKTRGAKTPASGNNKPVSAALCKRGIIGACFSKKKKEDKNILPVTDKLKKVSTKTNKGIGMMRAFWQKNPGILPPAIGVASFSTGATCIALKNCIADPHAANVGSLITSAGITGGLWWGIGAGFHGQQKKDPVSDHELHASSHELQAKVKGKIWPWSKKEEQKPKLPGGQKTLNELWHAPPKMRRPAGVRHEPEQPQQRPQSTEMTQQSSSSRSNKPSTDVGSEIQPVGQGRSGISPVMPNLRR